MVLFNVYVYFKFSEFTKGRNFNARPKRHFNWYATAFYKRMAEPKLCVTSSATNKYIYVWLVKLMAKCTSVYYRNSIQDVILKRMCSSQEIKLESSIDEPFSHGQILFVTIDCSNVSYQSIFINIKLP